MNQITVRGVTETQVVQISIPGVQAPGVTRTSLEATETIPAASFVHIHSSGGEAKLRLADASDGTRPADGYCELAIASGSDGVVVFGRSLVISGLTGLTPGIEQWLSLTAGGTTEVVPSADGNLIQRLGKALTATTMLYTFERGVTL